MKREDLNRYQRAYTREFKFYEENLWYLDHYARSICRSIRDNRLRTLLSLGIGHRVVTDRLIGELGNGLDSYTILEGSGDIIGEFAGSQDLPDSVRLVHTYFEAYSTDDRFDAIEMGFVLEHVEDPEGIVATFKELLVPGGTLFIAVPNARSLHRVIGYEAGLLEDVYQLSPQDHELGHKRYFDLDSITDLVRSAGLDITRRQGLMLKPVTGDQIRQLGWGKNVIDALFAVGDDYPEIANCIMIEARR